MLLKELPKGAKFRVAKDSIYGLYNSIYSLHSRKYIYTKLTGRANILGFFVCKRFGSSNKYNVFVPDTKVVRVISKRKKK